MAYSCPIGFMPVTSRLVRKHNDDNVWWAASYIDAATEAIEMVSNMWLDGVSFIYPNLMRNETALLLGQETIKREKDTDEEIDACADYLYGLLQDRIITNWATHLPRDAAVTLGRIMESVLTPDIELQAKAYGSAYTIVTGVVIRDSRWIKDRWNTTHPDEKPISMDEFYSPFEKGA